MDATMGHTADIFATAHHVYARAGGGGVDSASRPPIYKVIGIVLAISSGAFIGTSFVLKKYGLLKANEKYNEVAGEGYGYLKNAWWWSGMTLMIVGEICNFVAYAFTDAILVTPLGALTVVIAAVLSAIFLKERLSMVGKVACFLCIVGSVVIVMNAPQQSAVANIEQMQSFVISPGFLSYTGVIVLGSVAVALYAGPRWGKRNMLVYISICSWIGGLSVVATQGLGAAILTQIAGTPQFNGWFIWVLLVFVISTLLTEIVFLNKALNLFNAALVTPTYYVYFTSTTIITSAVLFQGFKGTPTSIVTVVMGFLTICAGVVLLQLSRSAKDVPDSAVFAGDLDQIQTIAEQEQPETDPKADAIRGTAAIVRRLSSARMRMEAEELKRLHEEKQQEALETLSEHGPQYEWDGLRRRRTMMGSQRSRAMTSPYGSSSPFPNFTPNVPPQPTPHPPLGWSHFPTQEELDALDRPSTPGALSSIVGTIRSRTRSVLIPNPNTPQREPGKKEQLQSPMHPVQLTEIAVPQGQDLESGNYYGKEAGLGILSSASKVEYQTSAAGTTPLGTSSNRRPRARGASGIVDRLSSKGSEVSSLGPPPTPPPHSSQHPSPRKQFSFQTVFRKNQQHGSRGGHGANDPSLSHHDEEMRPPTRPGGSSRVYSSPQVKAATEEERLGLVKRDSRSMPALPRYEEEEPYSEFYTDADSKKKAEKYGRGITTTASGGSSPPRRSSSDEYEDDEKTALADYEAHRRRWNESKSSSNGGSSRATPPPPPHSQRKDSPPRGGGGSTGAFI